MLRWHFLEDICSKDIFSNYIFSIGISSNDIWSNYFFSNDIHSNGIHSNSIHSNDIHSSDIHSNDMHSNNTSLCTFLLFNASLSLCSLCLSVPSVSLFPLSLSFYFFTVVSSLFLLNLDQASFQPMKCKIKNETFLQSTFSGPKTLSGCRGVNKKFFVMPK